MFRVSTVLSALAIFLLGISWFSFLNHRIDPPMPEKKHDSKALLSSSEQIRHRVCKDIWLVDALGQRLHHRIESDRSLITFHPHGASIEVLEHLFGVRCWVQEKNTSTKESLQQIRFVLAEEGLYHYQNQSFQAQDVLLSMYKIPGTTFPKSLESYPPFLRGTAESITFSLQKGAPKFEAHKFKASLGAKAT
jgi:hypothetical protein